MRIVADEQLAGVREMFAPLGELELLPAEALTPAHLADADALLVRSVTRVDAALVENTPLRFVGSATSGLDHIDTALLQSRGIQLADARGSNAEAVTDYCMAAIAHWQTGPATLDVGLVGCGEIGSRVRARLQRLGHRVHCCDPPLALQQAQQGPKGTHGLQESPVDYHSLEALQKCQVVTLHVPLTTTGPYPTAGLIDAAFLEGLPANSLLLNTCRGGVVREHELLQLLSDGGGLAYISDVWAGEPDVDSNIVAAALLATPHLAGYSRRAKLEATRRLLAAFCDSLGCAVPGADDIAAPEELLLPAGRALSYQEILSRALPLARISTQFKTAVAAGRGAEAFRTLRQESLLRREFRELVIDAAVETDDRPVLESLGFELETSV